MSPPMTCPGTMPYMSYLVQVQNREQIDEYWLPDLFVDQAIQTRNPSYKMPTESLKVYEDSTIRFSKRLNFDIACHMDFKQYPVDDQLCSIKFESFGYTKEEIQWLGEMEEIHLAQFDHHMYADTEYDTDYYKQSYSGLVLRIHLIRRINYQILETYLPSIIYVCIAFFAILVPSSVNTSVLNKKGREDLSQKIEFWVRLLYPILFLVLNMIYWSVILYTYFSEKDDGH